MQKFLAILGQVIGFLNGVIDALRAVLASLYATQDAAKTYFTSNQQPV